MKIVAILLIVSNLTLAIVEYTQGCKLDARVSTSFALVWVAIFNIFLLEDKTDHLKNRIKSLEYLFQKLDTSGRTEVKP